LGSAYGKGDVGLLKSGAHRLAMRATGAMSEERYWWQRVCKTAQMGGEASAHDSKGWRVSMSAMVELD